MTTAYLPQPATPRVAPSVNAALVLYAGYLALFFTTWVVNDVDYMTIGHTAESARLHYALPTLFGSAFLVVMLTVFGWWRITLFDAQRSGPRWAWLGPLCMFGISASAFLLMRREGATPELVLWCVLGGIGVGFGEEMATRGALLVGLRARHTEQKAWLISTLMFSALHVPNVLFGEPLVGVLGQLVMTFLFGSLLYAARRLSGTLLLPMFLHGFWDTSLFLPRATGSDPNLWAFAVYPAAIACAVAVVRQQRGLRLGGPAG
jgi:membrane protease YdiL (CAAX protease family)